MDNDIVDVSSEDYYLYVPAHLSDKVYECKIMWFRPFVGDYVEVGLKYDDGMGQTIWLVQRGEEAFTPRMEMMSLREKEREWLKQVLELSITE